MPFRFFKRIRIAPGLSINLSKSGASLSIGPRGAKVTIGPRGTRATVGIPGSGLYYTEQLSRKSPGRTSRAEAPASPEPVETSAPQTLEEALDLNLLERLTTSKSERVLLDAVRAWHAGDALAALQRLEEDPSLPDSGFLAGFLCLGLDRFDASAQHFERALSRKEQLGNTFGKHGILMQIRMPLTESVAVESRPDEMGARLGLVEAYQRLGRSDVAVKHLKLLWQQQGPLPLILLSLLELYSETHGNDPATCKEMLRLTQQPMHEDSDITAAILLYRARALRQLGMNIAARDLLTKTLRRAKHYSRDLSHALRYERILVYEALGQAKRMRSEAEKLYADAPDYEDLAERLQVP